jgi:hypothetical protein
MRLSLSGSAVRHSIRRAPLRPPAPSAARAREKARGEVARTREHDGGVHRLAADLRKRALEVKKQDEGLRKRDLEERDELKGFVKDANAELRCEPQRSQQQRQVLKGSQRAMKGSVSHIITVGLKDFQNRKTDFKVMTSVGS